MKVIYEIMATVLALGGAVALGIVYFPILNPVQFRLTFGQESAPLSRYFFGIPASLLILGAAWYFNRKATRLKREEQDAKRFEQSQGEPSVKFP